MIIDLARFVETERPTWTELERALDRIDQTPDRRIDVSAAMRLHFLYQKTAADLGKISTFASDPALKRYLESLVGRAYSEVHETRTAHRRFAFFRTIGLEFPSAFQRRIAAFWLSLAITMAGALLGGFGTALDPDAKKALLPEQFAHLLDDPAQRVAEEEQQKEDRLEGARSTFSGQLMVNNIRVSILALALGMTWGSGTLVLLFYNGIILGLVAADYVIAGQTEFLLGWLLPHGVVEIPAILIAGQAGFVIAGALIGRGDRTPLTDRLKGVLDDVCVLILGVAVMLVWAGLVESFLSQLHEPAIPYSAKIGFGVVEFILLCILLFRRIPAAKLK